MQRPASIVRFELFYLANIALSLLATALNWSTTMAIPAVQQAAETIGAWYLPASVAFGVLVQLLLWYFAARRGSAIAKWILVVFFGLALLSTGFALVSGQMPMTPGSIVVVLAFAAYAAATTMLFAPDSKAWFAATPEGVA